MRGLIKIDKKINIKFLIGILVFLVLFFAVFIFINEYTLIYGEEVFLKTVPVDPRDLLRGDYVILSYEIQQDERISNLVKEENLSQGDTIYLILNKNEEKIGELKRVSLSAPNDDLYIKTKIGSSNWRGNNLEMGIDKYFVPENKGRQVERLRDDLKVLVSIDQFGVAKIKDLYYNGTKFEFN